QRVQRIRPCRAPGWSDECGAHPEENDRQRTQIRDGIGRADAEQHTAQKSADACGPEDPDSRADRTKPQPPSEKLTDDRKSLRARSWSRGNASGSPIRPRTSANSARAAELAERGANRA